MDVVRSRSRLRAIPKGAVTLAVAIAFAGFGAWGIFSLAHPARAQVTLDRAAAITDVAKRGTLVRSIRTTGTFAPQHITVVSAPADGLVESLPLKAGAHVVDGTVIARLRNADLEADVIDLRSQIVAARAELAGVREDARSNQLDTVSSAQTATAERQQAQTQAHADAVLHNQGLISDVTFDVERIKVRELRDREAVAQSKIGVAQADMEAKIAVAQAKIAQLEAQLSAKTSALEALTARAATDGTVQSVAVDPGQRVAMGGEIARIADERDLKAVLLVPEADAHDVTLGLPVAIDTGSAIARGYVARIDPAAQDGSVAIDVVFDGAAPAGARPALHVDGEIQLERIPNALSIARPAGAADDSEGGLYKVVDGGTRAVRVHVSYGRGSADRIQVRSGIAAGDTVIVSDTSAAQNAGSIQLR